MLRWLVLLAVYVNSTRESGITFTQKASKTGHKYLIESTTGGVAMFDYDNDGWLDLYFTNGAELKAPMAKGAQPVKTSAAYHNRLYRNKGDGTFEDVTAKAGVAGEGYGMGVAVGDYDNDGDTDLYVTAFRRNQLYRNNGDGTFTDVTAKAGTPGGGWSSSAAFLDADNDGRLDLFVTRYVQWDFEPDLWCGARQPGYRSYCHPDQFQPIAHVLYRNKGDGTFEDVSAKSGIAAAPGKGLGVAIADFNRDGRVDIAVANDSFPQQLFVNRGGRFEEIGFDAGVAYDDDGNTFGGMGVDFQDYDNDGWPDLMVNALSVQRYALYRNRKGSFEYYSALTGIASLTRLNSGWGMKLVDYDNDGWRDVIVAQGHVMDNIQLTQPQSSYKEPLKLLRNVEGKRFAEQAAFKEPLAARGAAFGDLNNDGYPEIAVNCLDGAAVVYRHEGGPNAWVGLKLVGRKSNRDAIGAVIRAGDYTAMVSATGSYLAANDRRVVIGLGEAKQAPAMEITWPSGVKQTVTDLPLRRYTEITEAAP
ncbi:MAG: CRTAC1 family protein [Bryobacterales bacterium]|nr:CRTAC1 family protein [Bryobacterales bacterium]